MGQAKVGACLPTEASTHDSLCGNPGGRHECQAGRSVWPGRIPLIAHLGFADGSSIYHKRFRRNVSSRSSSLKLQAATLQEIFESKSCSPFGADSSNRGVLQGGISDAALRDKATVNEMPHGQIVIGPPGAGKSTYCAGMTQFLNASGRKAVVFNMDPANDSLPYQAAVSIRDLVRAEDVASQLHLGPNGSLLYAMEMLETNFEWLKARLEAHKKDYILFDFPGQVELYTHNDCIQRLVQRMTALNYRLAQVNLVDSHYCTDASKYIAVLLTSLTIALKLELPAVNVLSKIDLIEQYGELEFPLEYYTECTDLRHLTSALDADPFARRYAKLNRALCEVIEDFPWVGYQTLNIQDRDSVLWLARVVDKANGYSFANLEMATATYRAIVGLPEHDSQWVADVQERYTKGR